VKKDTLALGVLVVTVHHAENLSAQDSDGTSDPYIVLSFAKFGKPMYSTRIITGDLNPVWEETAFVLVTQEEVKAEEDLSATLWDSDKRTADDLVGRVTVPLTELMAQVRELTWSNRSELILSPAEQDGHTHGQTARFRGR
jgi:Ca2+-dependent lipid-binding protein